MNTTESSPLCVLPAATLVENQSKNFDGRHDTLDDTFPERIQFIPCKTSTKNNDKKKRNRLNIHITSVAKNADTCNVNEGGEKSFDNVPKQRTLSHKTIVDSDDYLDSNDLDDFFSETHEEQDMAHVELVHNRKKKRKAHDLAQLESHKEETELKLIAKLQDRWESEIKSLHSQMEGLNQSNADKYEKALQNLNKLQSEYYRNLETKRLEEHKMVVRTANENNEQINAKYRQWSEQNRSELPPQLQTMRDQEIMENNKSAELAQANIDSKAAQLSAEAEKEHQKKLVVLQNHQARNKSELEKLMTKNHMKRELIHEFIVQHVMNDHKEKFSKLKQDMLCDTKDSDVDKEDTKKRNGFEDFDEDDECTRRHSKRKNILSKVYIPTFITVDIRNEGLDIICLKGPGSASDSLSAKDNRKFSTTFIPWGYKARKFLYSIMCGEVPDHDIIDYKFLYTNGLQGLVKCTVVDKRVSARDASDQRLNAMYSQSFRDTDQAAADMNGKLSKYVSDETQAMEVTKQSVMVLDNLKRKIDSFKKEYFHANLDEDKKRQVLGYISKLNERIVIAEKDVLFKSEKLAFIRKQRIDTTEAIKNTLAENHIGNKVNSKRESMQEYHGSDVLCNFLLCFSQITGKGIRSNDSSGNASKRVALVLRCPRHLKREAEFAIDKYNSTRDAQTQIEKDRASLIRTEELLLLSLHPYLEEQLPARPPTSSSSYRSCEVTWAEPGWHLDLRVPTLPYTSSSSLLKTEPDHCVFNQHLNELSSSSGHQLAAFLSSHHIRALQDDGRVTNDSDFFCMSEQKLKESYKFYMPPTSSRSRPAKKTTKSKDSNGTKSKQTVKKKTSDQMKAM